MATSTVTVDNAVASTKPPKPSSEHIWETGPMQLIPTPTYQTGQTDPFTNAASEMALVHNCIIRAINTIYHQAPLVTPSDYKSFTSYCLATYEGLEAHHNGEEEHFFPEVERLTGITDIMSTNISQHAAFHTAFDAWGNWLKAVKSGDKTFDGKQCVRIMDQFMAPLATHLADEIPTLLALAEYADKIDIQAILKAEAEQVMAKMSKTTQLPLILLNHDTTFEGGIHRFPPLPGPVIWVLREAFGRWNADWWKFAACGFDGRPKALYAS
ncbi:hypothetical protein BU24DRAFT_427135 [Aaosphaeria arxii CBS 175.79]|uniref:Hemerythrin-like domain-containing protein n=1 Tax=Aaosphaeria arxii CBS 175.79 TaxID=1450172 RepID=A0A6A5XDE7_9PLEO|nr:uncharacterized protein BU24DRAFT_427135 [Aaosphaeria arxii CBS 175.79]KAF2010939.1 hypothetical protein BU24DRAFT_427135 [Aaosphaeria arxii CBS 175.79]